MKQNDITYQDVLKSLRELSEAQKDTDRQIKETS